MARNRQRARERKQKVPRDDVPAPVDGAEPEPEEQELEAVDDVALEQAAVAAAPPPGRDVAERPSARSAVSERSGPRVLNFLRACWAELQRVQWPDRRQVAQATAVVLGFCVLAGVYLGIADYLAKKLVDYLI